MRLCRLILRHPLALLRFAALACLLACALPACATATAPTTAAAQTVPTATTIFGSSATATPIPTQAPQTPTATPDPCDGSVNSAVPGDVHGLPLPAGAILSNITEGAMDGVIRSFSFTVVTVCIPTTAPDAVDAFYIAQMSANGWKQSATFPYNGNLDAACGDPYCWSKDAGNNITLAVALENVHTTSAGTLFTIRYMDYNTADNVPTT